VASKTCTSKIPKALFISTIAIAGVVVSFYDDIFFMEREASPSPPDPKVLGFACVIPFLGSSSRMSHQPITSQL